MRRHLVRTPPLPPWGTVYVVYVMIVGSFYFLLKIHV